MTGMPYRANQQYSAIPANALYSGSFFLQILVTTSELISQIGVDSKSYSYSEHNKLSNVTEPLRFSMEHQIIKYALSHNLPISFYEDCFFSKQPMFNLESLALHNKETCSRRLLLLSVLYSLRIPRGYVTWKLRRAFITFTEFFLSRNTRSDCYTKKSPLAAFLTKRDLRGGLLNG
jgi:hypothetical protein